MYILAGTLIALILIGLAILRTNYRHAHRMPALSCLAPNRSTRQNYFCQNATPRGGYCHIHHNQASLDNAAPWMAGFLGICTIGAATYFQLNPLPFSFL
jgi:hypothetical protein